MTSLPIASIAIFLSAFLLFLLEPMVAKRILPAYGGSAAVWTTCLVFYQVALLLGYAYAALLATGRQGKRWPRWLHTGLVLVSILLLPWSWQQFQAPGHLDSPTLQILLLLTTSIGLPFVLLSSTSPLLQDWVARAETRFPYRLFAVSNAASLCALLAYPTLVEPRLALNGQMVGWAWCYAVFGALVIASAWTLLQRGFTKRTEEEERETIRLGRPFALAACSSILLLAVTNHLTQNVAAVPLLWVLPLSVYLLSFIVAFGASRPPNRSLWLRLLAFALGVLAFLVYDVNAVEAMQVSVPILLVGLYICCFFCHAEVYRMRPKAGSTGLFYLAIAAGGAVGAIAIGVLAPVLFRGVYDLPIALLLTSLTAAALIWVESRWPLRLLAVGVCLCMAATVVANVQAYAEDTLALRRSFYGSLRVVQRRSGSEAMRILFHGTIEHGAQYLLPPRRNRPITYYGPDSGVGIVLREFPKSPKRVGVIGLGTGTVAALAGSGDHFQFFEINPQVVDLATTLFTYLRESKAQVKITLGDGRLAIDQDHDGKFDILVLDAFSGDAIPVHLITREAMQIYRRHLQPDGALLVHVSNDFLDLPPVVARLAQDAGYEAVLVHSHANVEEDWLPADWMLLTRNPELLGNSNLRLHGRWMRDESSAPLWTDQSNDLLQILKTPKLR